MKKLILLMALALSFNVACNKKHELPTPKPAPILQFDKPHSETIYNLNGKIKSIKTLFRVDVVGYVDSSLLEFNESGMLLYDGSTDKTKDGLTLAYIKGNRISLINRRRLTNTETATISQTNPMADVKENLMITKPLYPDRPSEPTIGKVISKAEQYDVYNMKYNYDNIHTKYIPIFDLGSNRKFFGYGLASLENETGKSIYTVSLDKATVNYRNGSATTKFKGDLPIEMFEVIIYNGETMTSLQTFKYNDNGYLIEYERYADDKLKETTLYNASGQTTKSTYYNNLEASKTAEEVYQYNEAGYLTSLVTKFYDENGALGITIALSYVYKIYDGKDNWTKREVTEEFYNSKSGQVDVAKHVEFRQITYY